MTLFCYRSQNCFFSPSNEAPPNDRAGRPRPIYPTNGIDLNQDSKYDDDNNDLMHDMNSEFDSPLDSTPKTGGSSEYDTFSRSWVCWTRTDGG